MKKVIQNANGKFETVDYVPTVTSESLAEYKRSLREMIGSADSAPSGQWFDDRHFIPPEDKPIAKVDGDGWIEWNGGEPPSAYFIGGFIKYRCRNGMESDPVNASKMHFDSWEHNAIDWDIVAYKELS